jgi:hypothetical protein
LRPSIMNSVLNPYLAKAARAASLFLVFLSAPVWAEQASEWNLSGFGTAGLVAQSAGSSGGFRRDMSQPGARSDLSASQDSRLGLQLNWQPDLAWEGAVQAVAAQRASGAPLSESVEWAFIGYRPLADTRVRVGRVSPDIFLFSDSRNVGFALPWARPPVEFYGFAPGTSVNGVDLEQRWSSGTASWHARLTGGSFTASATSRDGDRIPIRGRQTLAMGLTREEDGLLVKASIFHSRLSIGTGAQSEALLAALQQLRAIPLPGLTSAIDALGENLWAGGSTTYFALGTQYDTGPWNLTAEASVLRVPGSPLSARRGYVSLGYRHDSVTYYGLLSRVAPDKAAAPVPDFRAQLSPVLGAAGAAQAQQLLGYAQLAGASYRFDQSTVAVGARWDVTPSAALKLQMDHFDVRANGGAGWANGDTSGRSGTLVSLSVDFVWGQ